MTSRNRKKKRARAAVWRHLVSVPAEVCGGMGGVDDLDPQQIGDLSRTIDGLHDCKASLDYCKTNKIAQSDLGTRRIASPIEWTRLLRALGAPQTNASTRPRIRYIIHTAQSLQFTICCHKFSSKIALSVGGGDLHPVSKIYDSTSTDIHTPTMTFCL